MVSRLSISILVILQWISTVLLAQPSHEIFDKLLKKYVTEQGIVNYPGFVIDTVELNRYLAILEKQIPQSTWSKNDQMAYWINAYNAYTIKLICKYYPIKSIKEIGSSIQVPFVNSPWDIRFIRIGNEKLDLNAIEHIKLRKQFKDPRIHVALVCASKSCPILLNKAYTSANLENQLNEQSKRFLTDPKRNQVSAKSLKISMIFNWYSTDFLYKGGSVITFINQYAGVNVPKGTKIEYLDYDWTLNE